MKKVIISAYHQCWAMSLYTARDLFRIAELLEQHLGMPKGYEVEIASANGQPVSSACGASLAVDAALPSIEQCDLVVIPPMEGRQLSKVTDEHQQLTTWLTKPLQRQVPVVALTTGVALVAANELGKGIPYSTHWAFIKPLQLQYPNCKFSAQQSYSRADHIYSSGTLNGGIDALLSIIAEQQSDHFAQQVAAHMLVAPAEQLNPLLPGFRNHQDMTMLKLQDWLEQHYAAKITIQRLAQQANISERSLKRRFKSATGVSPNQYLQQVRIDKAKKLLLSTQRSVKDIGHSVGYENISFFIRRFQYHAGTTPAQWRRSSAESR